MAISSAVAGIHVQQLINVFEKIRYIEFRQISQILTDELTEKQNVIQALECECRSWVAARRRFKDVHQVNWHWQFMKNWRETASEALSTWQERGAKLFDSFELELYAEPWPRFVEWQNVQLWVVFIKELQICMPAKFSMLLNVEMNVELNIEFRQISQILTDESTENQRVIQAPECEGRSVSSKQETVKLIKELRSCMPANVHQHEEVD